MKRGTVVSIVNSSLGGGFFVEGSAIVLRYRKDGMSSVRFVESGDECERFIDPAAQKDPQAFVKMLNAQSAALAKVAK